LSRQLLRHPELIDQLVLRGAAALVRERADLRDDLANRLRPLSPLEVEAALIELRRFHNEEVLRIALHDVAGALAIEQVSRQLSDLADACVEACFSLARAEIERRYGKRDAAMVVLALGKLGGRELGYHSDLDLLFLYSSAGEEALFERAFAQVIEPSVFRPFDRAAAAKELLSMRERMEREIADESPGRYNSKLGRGGLVDVEFAVQFLQLAHGADDPQIRSANTPQALGLLLEHGHLAAQDHAPLARGYRFLRRLESRLRIVRDRSVDRL